MNETILHQRNLDFVRSCDILQLFFYGFVCDLFNSNRDLFQFKISQYLLNFTISLKFDLLNKIVNIQEIYFTLLFNCICLLHMFIFFVEKIHSLREKTLPLLDAHIIIDFCFQLADIFEMKIDGIMQSLGYCCGKKYVFNPRVLYCDGKRSCTIPLDGIYYKYQKK